MTIPLGDETVEIWRPATLTDPDGSRRRPLKLDTANATLIASIDSCSVQPFLMAEKLQVEYSLEREYSQTSWRIFAPTTTVVIEPTDWVKWRGEIYEVFGFPGVWRDSFPDLDHTEIIMRKRRG